MFLSHILCKIFWKIYENILISHNLMCALGYSIYAIRYSTVLHSRKSEKRFFYNKTRYFEVEF